MKRMMAITMLAVIASLGSQTAFASSGVLLSDRDGVLLSDKSKDVKTPSMINIIVVYMKTGVLLSDRDGVLLSD
jgi:hypothetical protein